jgi:hypothetical protein
MRKWIVMGVVGLAVAAIWSTGAAYRGEGDGPAPPQVQAFADCLSAAGVVKAETSNDDWYGSEGRIFVPGGEVWVFSSREAAEDGAIQIEADDASPQVVSGTVTIIGVPDQSAPFPMNEAGRCAYSGAVHA